MLKGLRRLARRGMELTGLIGPCYRWLEQQAARAPDADIDDGRPMPPRELIVLVSGSAGQGWFSERGQADAVKFLGLAAAHGLDLGAPRAVLDFGCGAGRIARWVAPRIVQAGGTFHGCDINPALVAWCSANLSGRYVVNGLRSPLDLPAATLDLVYAHSVLTHLAEGTARTWLAEVARVLAPDGLAILTFHDESYAGRWGPPEVAAKLKAQSYVVWNNALEGSNYMSAWTTRAAFAELAAPWFEVLETVPGGIEIPTQAMAVMLPRKAAT